MPLVPASPAAYKLLHRGALCMAQATRNGIRIDPVYIRKAKETCDERVRLLQEEAMADEVGRAWRKRYGSGLNWNSRRQLGVVLSNMGVALPRTRTGGIATHKKAFDDVDIPFTRLYKRIAEFKKIKATYLEGFEEEAQYDGRYWLVHPFYNLHTVRTYRSCVAKGTLIEVVRDVSKAPNGVPIESVKAGDYVYCYDDDLNLVIKKVLWAGKTGHRKVVRLHWKARGKRGYLDVTPEHLVRLVNGEYVPACSLHNADFRGPGESKHAAKVRTLALGRRGDELYYTGCKKPILDHRLVYASINGVLNDSDVVHHKDHNHLNNVPANLERMSRAGHAALHSTDSFTDEGRRKGLKTRQARHAKYGDRWNSGAACSNYLDFTKYQLLRLLAMSGGRASKAGHDFETLKTKAAQLGVDLHRVKSRYDAHGDYITLGRLRAIQGGGQEAALAQLHVGRARAVALLKERGLGWGFALYGNHSITKVEWLSDSVDVYDLEVEDCHNFIANEICVHNSSDSPNFQNISNRDKELAGLVRRAFIARDGFQFGEFDFKAAEVCWAAVYNKDPQLVKYVSDPVNNDMHRDMACQIFKLDPSQVTKIVRNVVKAAFVFAEFYGDYYVNVAKSLWDSVDRECLKLADGTLLRQHITGAGWTQLGACLPGKRPQPGTFEMWLKSVEDHFWNVRFPVYTAWKRDWWAAYQKEGGYNTLTGFKIEGLLSRNQCLNYCIQGSSFHGLLWVLCELQEWLWEKKMRSLIIGQIHDSVVGDLYTPEIPDIMAKVHELVTKRLAEHWPCINVPMVCEAEIAPPWASWWDKKEVKFAA